MKKITSALALAALLGVPAAQAEVDFGGDFDVRGFGVDMGDNAPGVDDARGYQQRIRLRAHFKNDDGVQVHTRFNLTDRTWQGDTFTDGTNPYSPDAADNVTLDYGFVQIPAFGGIVRVGRQEANWNNHLLSSDDRRDRISFIKPMGGMTLVLVHDKRIEDSTYAGGAVATNNNDDDRDLYAGAVVGAAGGFSYGFLAAYFTDADNSGLNEVKLVSPWVSGDIGPVKLTGGFNYLWGGEDGALWGGESGFADSSITAYLRGAFDFGPVKLEAQYAGVRDGGLMGGGFDTYSSLINNSPDNNQSPTSVVRLGGISQEDLDRDLLALRVTGKIGDKVTLMGAVGGVKFDNGNDDDTSSFVDLQAHYQVTPSTKLWLTVGQLSENDVQAGLTADDVTAASLNLKTNF